MIKALVEAWMTTVPSWTDSTNGRQPLAHTLTDLWWWEFDYNRATTVWLHPTVVLVALVAYLISKPLLLYRFDCSKSIVFQYCVALHNLFLCFYSAWTVVHAWPAVWMHYQQYGDTYCDPHGTLWNDTPFGTLAFLFYLSKFVEFVDTWILLLKHKEASFLQVYHHTGIVLAMYGGVLSHASWLTWVVLLNSVIHTIMYLYFFIKTLSPTTHIPAARYLTQAQIAQFFTGIVGSTAVFWKTNCGSPLSKTSLAFLHVYGYGLIVLFAQFAQRKYHKKKK